MKLNRSKLYMLLAEQMITLKMLAEKADVSYYTIKKGLTKDIRPDMVGKIANALDVNIRDII